MAWRPSSTPQVGHHLAVEIFLGAVLAFLGHLTDTAGDVLNFIHLRGDRIKPVRLDDEILVARRRVDELSQHLGLVDQNFEGIIDFMRQADGDFGQRDQLVAPPDDASP